MSTKLSQAIEQLQTAGGLLTVMVYVPELEKFRALAMMNGAAIKSDWIDQFGRREIRESLDLVIDGQTVIVATHRTPTVRDWSDLAEKRDERDPKAVIS